MLPRPIEEAAKKISSLPSIGGRQAIRLVFYLIKKGPETIKELQGALLALSEKIAICDLCFLPFEKNGGDLCPICKDNSRNKKIICVVEKETDLISMEKTGKFKGLYYILGGAISPLDQESSKSIRLTQLVQRIKNSKEKIEELIIATNPTSSGTLTAMYVERETKDLVLKITHLGRGLPTGGEIEFADEETLTNAIENRK